MIDWVHELAKEWGAYLRSLGNPYYSQNILDVAVRGWDYGPISLYDVDEEESEPEVLAFHRAFLRLRELNRDVIYFFYVPVDPMRQRLHVLQRLHGLSKSRAYEIRGQSHAQIWGYIDAHIQLMRAKKTLDTHRVG